MPIFDNEAPSDGASWRDAKGLGTKMTRHLRFSPGLLFSLFAFAFPGADRASAEGVCPPGFIPGGAMVPGQENAGWTGCLHAYDVDDSNVGPSRGGDSGPPPFNADEFRALLQWEKQVAQENEERLLKNNPVLRELKQGVWKFSRSQPKDPRQICTASFLQLNGGVLIMDWAGEAKGTLLAYFGGAIPPTADIRTETVSLTQSGETQRVHASHASLPWSTKIGMVIFAVPSTQALLSSIEEMQDYSVELHGQEVIHGKWHSGSTARKWLSNCVSKRGK
ncbi:hypothetical protein IY145_03090 [Methylosinus sp. H3A]|uniref:hypothetical protein n=1 Tax=Methylosinus sp. H3A TaxID=2785786 RepID=UPI0018C335A9|nr:hypothetical protein [Methylosinus sp. H3A]MBG0808359.1 hypothetical protein [Methylosinus sp. H3A]